VKALTIRQPWTDAIVYGTKRTENRTRRTNYRGPILIHAGITPDRGDQARALHIAATLNGAPIGPDTRGAIIATARLAGCHPAADGCCPDWGFPECWHWELADVQPLTEPVPARGALGLWTPTPDLLNTIAAQPCPICDGTDGDHQIGCQQPTAMA
jgi:hypothetical protein